MCLDSLQMVGFRGYWDARKRAFCKTLLFFLFCYILDYVFNYHKQLICRASKLRSLSLIMSSLLTDKGFVEAVAKLPLLEELELEVSRTCIDLDFKAIGHSCPRMETLKLTYASYTRSRHRRDYDADALAIAESMPQLRHLQLIWNKLTDTGLKAILDKCPHLEHLDLRQCLKINLSGDLETRCLKMLKVFRPPEDSTAAF